MRESCSLFLYSYLSVHASLLHILIFFAYLLLVSKTRTNSPTRARQEIPTGLEIIGKGAKQGELSSGGPKLNMTRIVFSSLLRLAVGYLFLICLFLVVVQESSVMGIFFDVLALEFVEQLDDVIFALFKRGEFVCDDTTYHYHFLRLDPLPHHQHLHPSQLESAQDSLGESSVMLLAMPCALSAVKIPMP